MVTAIHVRGGNRNSISDLSFIGYDIAIDVRDTNETLVERVGFIDVGDGLKARGVSGLRALNNTESSTERNALNYPFNIDESKDIFHIAPLAQLVRWYITYIKRRD